jgi:pyrimidine-nucleoside phosphorylase
VSPVQLIRKVQDKKPLTEDEINSLIKGFHKGDVPEYQMSAFLMAVYYQGLNPEEKMNLTKSYINSGVHIDWGSKSSNCIDKHSTGGTGDKTSMILAPLLASLGYFVPMMAGRGLGHTGGTLDKLESLKGFNTDLSLENFKKTVLEFGGAIIGQTDELCPADKKLYALRDVTATVSSLPLITASIVSKKVAEGVKSIVYDVKTGSGAFIKKFEDSVELAESLVNTSHSLGLKACALITDMSQPLGRNVGNALEMKECFEILQWTDKAQSDYDDTIELTLRLGAHLLQTKDGRPEEDHYLSLKENLKNGTAYKKAQEIFRAQGWNSEPPKYSKNTEDLKIDNSKGYISAIDNEKVGWASVELGGGRKVLKDKIDPEVGFYFHKKLGDKVNPNEALVTVYYNSDERLEGSLKLLSNAFEFSDEPVKTPTLILKRI